MINSGKEPGMAMGGDGSHIFLKKLRRLGRTGLLAILLVGLGSPGHRPDIFADNPKVKDPPRLHAIDKRLPLTTSKVVGSPDPPPPYRAHGVFPNLKINFPIAITHQPGSDLLLVIHQD